LASEQSQQMKAEQNNNKLVRFSEENSSKESDHNHGAALTDSHFKVSTLNKLF
jgi:hypothetical protein